MSLLETDFEIRRAVYDRFARGGVPMAAELAAASGVDPRDVYAAYERLTAAHVLVLQPDSREVWMAMPFSAIATDFRFENGGRSWYANCAWDAFGIPAALECEGIVTTTCADCGAPLTFHVGRDGVREQDGVVHFSVPASRWWDDIGYT